MAENFRQLPLQGGEFEQIVIELTLRIVHLPSQFPDLAADLVLAADVLYEHRFLAPFLHTLEQVLRPGGTALVAEPGRAVAETICQRLS